MNEEKTIETMSGDEIIDAVIEALEDMNKVTVRLPEISLLKLFLNTAKSRYADEKKSAELNSYDMWSQQKNT